MISIWESGTLNPFSVGTDYRRQILTSKFDLHTNRDIYDDFKLKNPVGLHSLFKKIPAL